MAEGLARASTELSRNVAPASELNRDKSRRGSSFLSRLSMRPGRKKDLHDLDSDSEIGSDARLDGINARVFSQTTVMSSPLVGGGYVPHHKEPPRYIRTKASNKRTREFNRMFLAQELVGTRPPENDSEATTDPGKAPVVSVSVAGASDRKSTRTGGAIWATEFSKDGKYLASAGRDHVVRVWAVISTPEERRAHEEEESAHGGAGERLSAPVFRDQPVKEFRGHTGEVLDLSWSKNNFLLSSSMDKTVRLWHMSRDECLCTFKHKDFVTRLAFHPKDDRFFLAGSLDTMLRLWSIPDKAVAYSAQLPDLVTAVAFSPDGKIAIAGLLNGLCMFYETEGLKLNSQVHVRSSRGKNAKGSKITGIQTMAIPPPEPISMANSQPPSSASTSVASTDVGSSGEVRVLITSNDSRIRIYTLRDKALDVKLKGHENLCSQIAATFSDDAKYVICGSEDRKTFIWSLGPANALVQDKDKSPCEYFEAHGDIVTTALFAPTKTRMLLGQSGDPIYDLCNPPPVVLQSLEEAAAATSAATSQVGADPAPHPAPPPTESLSVSKRPEPSPAYIARSTHYDGNIIVTTGDTGIIKVFRQDCAFAKRRHDSWETGSTFSRKLAAAHGGTGGYVVGGGGGGLGRSLSVLTRTSGGSTAHSRRGSLSYGQGQGVGQGVGSVHGGLGPAVAGQKERILSWRLAIEHQHQHGGGHAGDRRSGLGLGMGNGAVPPGTPTRSERSASPTKASHTSLNSAYNASASLVTAPTGTANEARKLPYGGAAPSPARNRDRSGSAVASPTASVFSTPSIPAPSERVSSRLVKDRQLSGPKQQQDDGPTVPPTPGFTLIRPSDAAKEDAGNQQTPVDAASGGAGGGTVSGSGSTSFWNLGRWKGITTGFRANSSSSSGQGLGLMSGGGGKARSSTSRPSVSKSRGQTESEVERHETDRERGKAGDKEKKESARRQSVGVLPANGSGGDGGEWRADRRNSLPPERMLQG
ncbi:hypothetical protein VTI74DRAFT_5562 [Chaetomium olivicolor]